MRIYGFALLSAVSLFAVIGCDVGEGVETPALQSSALTAESTGADSDSVTILGKDALMKRIAQRRLESQAFAASMDGAYDGIAAGERNTIETQELRNPVDSIPDGADEVPDETEKPLKGVVPFSSTTRSGGLRSRIHAGVDPSDLEQVHDSEVVDSSRPPAPGPFTF